MKNKLFLNKKSREYRIPNTQQSASIPKNDKVFNHSILFLKSRNPEPSRITAVPGFLK